MNLKQMYEFFIQSGIEKDPRGKEEVNKVLEEKNEEYKSLSSDKKKDYDLDMLTNPYADSRIIFGTGEEEIKNIMVGIDIETPELLIANQLKLSGKKIDVVVGHHPKGKAFSTFYNVISMQAEINEAQGVPINVAEKLISQRMAEVRRNVLGSNHQRVSDAARLLNIPMMTAHTVADNHVESFLQTKINSLKPRYIKDIMNILEDIPEYKYAKSFGSGPYILCGNQKSKCGKVFVDMTGGAEGPVEMIEKLVTAGVGTIIGMHFSEKLFKEAQKQNLNVIIAGHISSDNLGVNLMLDGLEKKYGQMNFIECSGFRRFQR